MKQFIPLCLGLCLAFLVCACGGNSHFITDESYRARVEQDFAQKKSLIPNDELFAVFDTELTTYEREALEFLYAYMPLPDIADFPGEFHLANVRASLRAAEEMPWGKMIPEDLFRHFVLPTRINNEKLDSARFVFYAELKDRVKNLSMTDAILEVNHWCHEKVVYQPTDGRTSSPLSTVRTAYGRCGEESTFLVTALRSVGIPARQVYTPRWAHTDDNHAWVEAWADGEWHFLGACEPEPVLDLGWFNAPASRGMLMHTDVFGRYNGPEEIMSENPNLTEINILCAHSLRQGIGDRRRGQSRSGCVRGIQDLQLWRILHRRHQVHRCRRHVQPERRPGRHAGLGIERRTLRLCQSIVRQAAGTDRETG